MVEDECCVVRCVFSYLQMVFPITEQPAVYFEKVVWHSGSKKIVWESGSRGEGRGGPGYNDN